MKILLFTDIDGTLIDHHTYSTSIAKKALYLLKKKDIPVILCSSKTYDEQRHLQNQLGINFPFIIENGSAIVVPTNYFPLLAATSLPISDNYRMIVLAQNGSNKIKNALQQINQLESCKSYGYADSTDKEIARFTGLKGNAVQRAKRRWFTESLFSDPPPTEGLKILNEAGLSVSQGGRFLTIQDKDVNKGSAVKLLTHIFQQQWNEKPLTIGIGDSPNDAPLLSAVDKPFLVQQPDTSWAKMNLSGLTKVEAVGPNGFLVVANKIQALSV